MNIMASKYLIVGISGATNSGKTTAARKLCQFFPCASTMCQDNYFLEPDDPRLEIVPEVNHANWEKLSAMDMPKMLNDVNQWIQSQQARGDNSCHLLLIEGILIFNHKPLSKLFHKKYFFELDKDTCEKRRIERAYIPPDPPGYFNKVVWPMYLENMEQLKAQPDICYLNGAENQDYIVDTIQQDILRMINNPKI